MVRQCALVPEGRRSVNGGSEGYPAGSHTAAPTGV